MAKFTFSVRTLNGTQYGEAIYAPDLPTAWARLATTVVHVGAYSLTLLAIDNKSIKRSD